MGMVLQRRCVEVYVCSIKSLIHYALYMLQVYNCLQPLMICLSYRGTLELVDKLAEDWDQDVLPGTHSHIDRQL